MSIADSLAEVRGRIEAAARRAGRHPDAVRLVAVTKKKPAEDVRAALAAGCSDFGENYVQELLAKAAALEGEPVRLHYIGHLQRNKVKALLDCPALVLIHTVDRRELLDELERRAARPLEVLVQVNVSAEPTKSGCSPEALPDLLAHAERLERVSVRGLMTMPPPSDDPEQVRPFFRALAALRDEHGGAERLPELSMGMTQDYEVAVEEGATLVRIGSAIFGARD